MAIYRVENSFGDTVNVDYDLVISVRQAVKWQNKDVFNNMYCQHQYVSYQGDIWKIENECNIDCQYRFFAGNGKVIDIKEDDTVFVKLRDTQVLMKEIDTINAAKRELG